MNATHMNTVQKHVKDTFDLRSVAPSDNRGYVARPEDNLIAGVRMDQFENDLCQGAGNELHGKFCAVHSSSALAVNTFARFKDRLQDFLLNGLHGCDGLRYEAECDTGLRGTPPTLDVLVRRQGEVIGIESKFLEYFTPKQAKFSASYTHQALPWAEDCWWQVMEDAKHADKRHLDVAQLVKHYFGISRLLVEGDETGWKPAKMTLLYLFWEPENAPDIKICQQHRKEVQELAAMVKDSKVVFRWLSYPELWQEWSADTALREHVCHLKKRYSITVST